ncbi:hypothetical protein ABK040_001470 [Willaertia magna]
MKQHISHLIDKKFIELNLPFKIKQISSTIDSILILTTDFEIYLKGKIGNYNFSNFTKIENFKNIKHIACGEQFILLFDEFNNVFICGELSITKFNYFTKFDTIKNDEINFISCGADVAIITKNNKLLVCGLLEPFNGKDFTKEDGFTIFENLKNFTNIKDFQIGYYHSVLLNNFGDIYGSGKNECGQLGNTGKDIVIKEYTKLNVPFKVKKIAVYTMGTLLLNFNNEVFKSGENVPVGKSKICAFTKIILNESLIVKKLYHSGYTTNIILTNDGFYINDWVESDEKCDVFRKLDYEVKLSKMFCKPLIGYDKLFMIESEEIVNAKKLKVKKIYLKMYKQLLELKNTDILIICLFE